MKDEEANNLFGVYTTLTTSDSTMDISKIFILFHKINLFKSSMNMGGVQINISTNDTSWERLRGYLAEQPGAMGFDIQLVNRYRKVNNKQS